MASVCLWVGVGGVGQEAARGVGLEVGGKGVAKTEGPRAQEGSARWVSWAPRGAITLKAAVPSSCWPAICYPMGLLSINGA